MRRRSGSGTLVRDDSLVVGIDVGTGGCKVSILDSQARLIADSRAHHPSRYPHPGWVEQQPEDWIAAVIESMDSATALVPVDRKHDVKGIAFSASAHVAVLTDRNEEVLRPAIMWNDQRSGDQARRLRDRVDVSISSIAGNAPSPTWTLPQLIWLAENEPQIVSRISRIRFMKDWVRVQLSEGSGSGSVTDRIDAEGALLFDVTRRRWSSDLAALAGIAPDVLPNVVEPTHSAGRLSGEFAHRWGLATDVQMIVGTTDTAAELLAAGAVHDGDVVVKLATAGNVSLVTRGGALDPRLLRYGHVSPGLRYLNSATSAAAESLRWFVENFVPRNAGVPNEYGRVDDAVANVDPGSDGLIFAPFLHGERAPRFDEKLRGGFVGLTARHSWPEAVRAVMEGVAFSLRDAATMHGELPPRLSLVGGGARSTVWPQILSDVLDREISVAEHADSSIGAALIAGVSIGVFSSYEDAVKGVGGTRRLFVPNRARSRFYDCRFADYLVFAEAITALSHRLATDPWLET